MNEDTFSRLCRLAIIEACNCEHDGDDIPLELAVDIADSATAKIIAQWKFSTIEPGTIVPDPGPPPLNFPDHKSPHLNRSFPT